MLRHFFLQLQCGGPVQDLEWVKWTCPTLYATENRLMLQTISRGAICVVPIQLHTIKVSQANLTLSNGNNL